MIKTMQSDEEKLPPIKDETFDGERESVTLHDPIVCSNTDVKYVRERQELQCKCGAGWQGENLDSLYKLLKSF